MPSPNSAEVLAALIDADSWSGWDTPMTELPADPGYAEQITKARERSGVDESVITGEARIDGHRVAVLIGEFSFLAGSIGCDAAERIIAAFRRATAAGLPVIGCPISGGTRMQEGTPAFLRMPAIAGAVADHRAAGLPYLTWLRHPTTGGVFATWGSLGQVTLAAPGALVGFLGPRVYEEVYGEPFPPGVQVSENLVARGVVDQVVDLADLRSVVSRLLAVVTARTAAAEPVESVTPAPAEPWDRVLLTRRDDRPGLTDLLAECTDLVELSGTSQGEASPGLRLLLCRLAGRGVVLAGMDRGAQAAGQLIGPDSLRAARRGMRLAAELGLPFVSVVDTPGAELSVAAEEGAVAGEIARCLADLSQLPVPTVSVLLGQGSGGGALALLPADHTIATENSWVTPLPPEGAAAIVHRDAGRAPEMAAQQRITAADLAEVGAVDIIVPEADDWPAAVARAVGVALADPVRRRDRWTRLGR